MDCESEDDKALLGFWSRVSVATAHFIRLPFVLLTPCSSHPA